MQKLPSPVLVPTEDGNWLLDRDYFYCVKLGDRQLLGCVPAGYVTDLDSVPRIPIFYGWLKNRTRTAALLHDWLCYIGTSKSIADKAFLEMMRLEGVRHRYRYPIYWGVKYFGRVYSDLNKV